MEEDGFRLTEMDWNGESQFWPDWNWFGLEEVGFGLTGIVWNGGSRF
jgi:hypothetical protein